MSDCMTFPDTVEEFMEQYKIVDTEQVYTNGTELVSIFRMKQWFKHLPSSQPEIIRCKDCRNNHWCNIQEAAMAGDNFFCGAAERRTDERSNR